MAVTQSIFKLEPPDFAWKQIQIISTDDNDDDDDDDNNNKNHKSFKASSVISRFNRKIKQIQNLTVTMTSMMMMIMIMMMIITITQSIGPPDFAWKQMWIIPATL